MDTVVLDGKRFINRKEAHKYMKERFRFPDYYGGNLDALWDLLTERHEIEIVIENEDAMIKHLGNYGKKILSVFEDLSREIPTIVVKRSLSVEKEEREMLSDPSAENDIS
jgi:ribonuclease inhibitor